MCLFYFLSLIIENKGELTFSLKKTAALTPFAQVVVYTVLPSGEAVADSMNFPIEECLPNKVRKSHMKSHFRIQCALQAFMYFFFLSLMCDETVFVLLQVSLTFSSSTALPGEKRSLNLKASPGSLCSVRAIDQSVLLLRPETELNAAFVCYIIHNLHYNYS